MQLITTKEQLVEQHIREYDARQKHVDELIAQAKEAARDLAKDHTAKTELAQIQGQHAELLQQTEELKRMPLEHWREEMIQSAGPMAIWDMLAQQLEDLVERMER
ncbi:MAG: hypothetical protein OEY09_19445 [Gammaproteobacteria bacterium]|nr:hypothetical protein [Gammaproteobacteria bacterium]